jgi:hypothetical protein
MGLTALAPHVAGTRSIHRPTWPLHLTSTAAQSSRVLPFGRAVAAGERQTVSRLMDTFRKNQIVRVAPEHHWAKGALGTIAEPPAPVRKMTGDWEECVRMVETVQGASPYYWVRFHQPQLDADGDGPYAEGEIEARFLSVAHGGY